MSVTLEQDLEKIGQNNLRCLTRRKEIDALSNPTPEDLAEREQLRKQINQYRKRERFIRSRLKDLRK